jgi:hypothetical protein
VESSFYLSILWNKILGGQNIFNGNLPNSKIQHPVYHKLKMLRGATSDLCLYKLGIMIEKIF